MESTGIPGRIQLHQATFARIDGSNKYNIENRGPMKLSNGEEVNTYIVHNDMETIDDLKDLDLVMTVNASHKIEKVTRTKRAMSVTQMTSEEIQLLKQEDGHKVPDLHSTAQLRQTKKRKPLNKRNIKRIMKEARVEGKIETTLRGGIKEMVA